jgi:hypothetical protein
MTGFLQDLKTQRWDDHRYYHHSRINQSLHLVSALSFVCSYMLHESSRGSNGRLARRYDNEANRALFL